MKHRLELLAGKKKGKCSCGIWKYVSIKNDPKKALADVEKEHDKHAAQWVNGVFQKTGETVTYIQIKIKTPKVTERKPLKKRVCKKHPGYKAKKKPLTGCKPCWKLWGKK